MKLRALLFSLGLSLAGTVSAESAGEEAAVRKSLATAVPGLVITSVQPSAIPGLYEVQTGSAETLYVSGDGKHFVVGELYQIAPQGVVNLSEQRKEQARAQALASLSESDMVVFRPKQKKAEITVFTDVDCGYCRKLHLEVPRMNELGIQVNYVGYPRAGIGSHSYQKLVSIWCAEDQQNAMTLAKSGQEPARKECDNPVAAQFELGNRIGISGTPAILLEGGRLIPGYVPADALAKGLGLLN